MNGIRDAAARVMRAAAAVLGVIVGLAMAGGIHPHSAPAAGASAARVGVLIVAGIYVAAGVLVLVLLRALSTGRVWPRGW